VFTSVGDPIGSGIVKSLNRPGGNITGLHAQAAEIAGKRLQILEELSPGIRIVAALLEPDAPFTSVALPELKSAADARGQRLEICEVRTADRLAISVEAAAQAGATGLVSGRSRTTPRRGRRSMIHSLDPAPRSSRPR
jgi:putative ABC transport system substrate-binding protein